MESLLNEIKNYAKTNLIPIVRDKTAKLLIDTLHYVNPKNVLEIGTAIAYSTIIILNNCVADVVSIEKNINSYNVALGNIDRANNIDNTIKSRVSLINDDAINVISKFVSIKKFDFIFLDGPKGQYIKYLPILLQLLNKNGIIFADNVLFMGMVLKDDLPPKKHRTIICNLRLYLKNINVSGLSSKVFEIEDGVAITKKLY